MVQESEHAGLSDAQYRALYEATLAAVARVALPVARAERAHPFDVGTALAAPVVGTLDSATGAVTFDADAFAVLHRRAALERDQAEREAQRLEVENDALHEQLDAVRGELAALHRRLASLRRIRLTDLASGVRAVIEISFDGESDAAEVRA